MDFTTLYPADRTRVPHPIRMVPGEIAMYVLGAFGALLIIVVLFYYRFCQSEPSPIVNASMQKAHQQPIRVVISKR